MGFYLQRRMINSPSQLDRKFMGDTLCVCVCIYIYIYIYINIHVFNRLLESSFYCCLALLIGTHVYGKKFTSICWRRLNQIKYFVHFASGCNFFLHFFCFRFLSGWGIVEIKAILGQGKIFPLTGTTFDLYNENADMSILLFLLY